MTEFTAFACAVGEANLCLFNSTCNDGGLLDQECICQPGYMHDFTFFHSKNCGMPDLLLPIFVSIYSAIWLWIFIILLRKSWALGQSTAWLTRITVVYHISLEGCMALQAIQGGMLEGSIFFLSLMLWSMVVLIAQIIRQTFSFMNGMYADRIERMVSITTTLSICYFVFNVVFAGTMIAYARTDFYDVILLICISIHVTLLCTMALVVLCFMNGFLKDLDKNSRLAESPLLQDVYKRLRHMRYRWAFFFVNMFIAGACGIALRLVLRSLPFCFLITVMVWFNAMLLTLVRIYVVLFFTTKRLTYVQQNIREWSPSYQRIRS